jgi:hypothetical protein
MGKTITLLIFDKGITIELGYYTLYPACEHALGLIAKAHDVILSEAKDLSLCRRAPILSGLGIASLRKRLSPWLIDLLKRMLGISPLVELTW